MLTKKIATAEESIEETVCRMEREMEEGLEIFFSVSHSNSNSNSSDYKPSSSADGRTKGAGSKRVGVFENTKQYFEQQLFYTNNSRFVQFQHLCLSSNFQLNFSFRIIIQVDYVLLVILKLLVIFLSELLFFNHFSECVIRNRCPSL